MTRRTTQPGPATIMSGRPPARHSLTAAMILVLVILGGMTADLAAQSRNTEHTLALDEGAAPARATLDQAAWLTGHWHGSVMGAEADEVWLPAAGGAMLGTFRMTTAEATRFYEIFTLRADNGSLILQLKHFNADLTGWESQHETVDFRLVRVEPDALYFDGLTYRRISADEIHTFVAVQQGNGPVEELRFTFNRVQ